MVRRYRLGQRAEGVGKTHQRIIDATVELIRKRGLLYAHIDAVAKAAGVTRPTVYQHFGTKEKLWEEAFATIGLQPDTRLIKKAGDESDPVVGTKVWLKAWAGLWGQETVMIRQMHGFVFASGPLGLLERLEAVREDQAKALAARLKAKGQLSSGLTAQTATVQLNLLSSFVVFDTMLPSHKNPRRTTEFLLQLFEHTVLEAE